MPPNKFLLLTIISLIIFLTNPNYARGPIQENTYSFTVVNGIAVSAVSTPQNLPKTIALASFSYDWDTYHLISQYPLWDADLMTRIAFCESGFRTTAIGDRNTAHHSYGILQIRNLPSRNYPIETLFDPAENIRIAYEIWKSQGYGAWLNCYRKSI